MAPPIVVLARQVLAALVVLVRQARQVQLALLVPLPSQVQLARPALPGLTEPLAPRVGRALLVPLVRPDLLVGLALPVSAQLVRQAQLVGLALRVLVLMELLAPLVGRVLPVLMALPVLLVGLALPELARLVRLVLQARLAGLVLRELVLLGLLALLVGRVPLVLWGPLDLLVGLVPLALVRPARPAPLAGLVLRAPVVVAATRCSLVAWSPAHRPTSEQRLPQLVLH